jgi:hypothetical protein
MRMRLGMRSQKNEKEEGKKLFIKCRTKFDDDDVGRMAAVGVRKANFFPASK